MKKQFKKLLSILMVFCMVMGMVPVQAFAAEDYTWDSGAGVLTVNTDAGTTAWETAVSATEIKTVVVKNTVATIAGKVFQGLSNLESLTFEGDVTIQNVIVDSVYYYPFSETPKLAEITFGGKVNIGDGVFLYSESAPNIALKKLSFPAGSTFGSAVFSHCTALEEITFNGDVDITAGGCFYKTTALKKIDFKGESKIGSGAFGNAINITELNFTGKTSIGSGVFMYDSSAPNTTLKKLSFPVGSTFGSAVFRYCTALEEIVFNGDADVTAGGCFANLTALKKIDFKGESKLASDAFDESINLAEINFGGKTSIGSGVFTYSESAPNTALKKLSFPADSTFGSAVFSYCTALEEIVFNGDADVTSGSCFANLTALKKIDFKGESKLASGAFLRTTNLAEINFGGKTNISSGVFAYTESPNTALKSLTFPAGSTFSSGIFYSCNALKELVFEGNVDLTAGGSIYNVPSLEKIEFKGESKLASGTLSNAVKLKTLIFGGKTDIGNGVFVDAGSQQASGMDAIIIPAGSTIGISAFAGANITTIEFEDTTSPAFGVNAFAGCPQTGIIYVPAEAYDAYVAALNGDGSSTDVANPVPLQIKEKLPTTSVTVVKEWNAPDGTVLPESVEVYLLANGQEVTDSRTILDEGNNWTYTWEKLPVNNATDGKEIVYTVDEVEVENYEKTIGEAVETDTGIEIAITNSLKATQPETPATTSVTVVKEWNVPEGTVLPESVEVYLLANGQEVTDSRVSLDAGNQWTYTWLNLAIEDSDHIEIEYSVDEVEVKDYTKTVEKSEVPAGIGFVITNTLKPTGPEDPETVTVAGTKTWVGDTEDDRPQSIIVNLLANGKAIDEREVTSRSQWTYSFNDLPKCGEDGAEIEYTVEEEPVEGYTATYDGYNITNTKDSDEEGGNGGATTPTTPSAPSTPSVPDTSDNTGTLMYLATMAASTVALVFVLKKKKYTEE